MLKIANKKNCTTLKKNSNIVQSIDNYDNLFVKNDNVVRVKKKNNRKGIEEKQSN